MSDTFTLPDSLTLRDLSTYLGRAGRVEDGSVRLIAGGGVLAAYAAVLYPAGLLDESPTVLGLRTFALPQNEQFDVVVPLGSLLRRIEGVLEGVRNEHTAVTVSLPMQSYSVTWAAISPPRGGWVALGAIDSAELESAGRAGMLEVAEAIPDGMGEAIVHRVRNEVWGRALPGVDNVSAGAGFAAITLGFLSAEPESESETVPVYETGPWTRLSTKRGHILIKRRAWSLGG